MSSGAVAWLWIAAAWQTSSLAVAETTAVDVRGDVICPRPSEVAAALVGLILPTSSAADVATLRGNGSNVIVELTRASGELIARKVLPADSPSCAERAQTAAVMIAAWEVRLRTGAALPLDVANAVTQAQVLPSGTGSQLTDEGEKDRDPAERRAPVQSSAPTSVRAMAVPSAAISTTSTPRPPAPRPLLALEVGALASTAGGDIAPGATVGVSIGPPKRGFLMAAAAFAIGTHSTAVGDAVGTWRRFGGSVEGGARTTGKNVGFELRAGVSIAGLQIEGRGTPVTDGDSLLDPGVHLGFRARWAAGFMIPWIGVTGHWWPRTHNLLVRGIDAAGSIPEVDVLFALGAALPWQSTARASP